MQTRIIQTKFWKDEKILKMSLEAQHLFIYLLTCESINISGVFELPEEYLILETKLSQSQIQKAKSELQSLDRVRFCGSWTRIMNVEKYNNYRGSPKNQTAYEKEIALVPQNVINTLGINTDSSIDSSIDSNHKYKIINNKSEIINNKSKTQNHKSKIPGIAKLQENWRKKSKAI